MLNTTTTKPIYHTQFTSMGAITQDDGTAASGTAGEVNNFTVDGVPWTVFNLGTNTVLSPVINRTVNVGGLDVQLTDTDGQGGVFTPYDNSQTSPLAFTIGGPAFYMKVKVRSEDWSSHRFLVGFHGGAAGTATQAHQTLANIAAYTDKALIGQYTADGVDVKTSTCLNDAAGDTDTDTTINLTDGDVAEFTVYVSAAGAVTYALRLAATATPTTFVTQTLTTVAFSFDTGDVVVPMIYAIADGDGTDYLCLQEFTCGYQ